MMDAWPDSAGLAGIVGAGLGALHVLSGPDHMAAVLPMALRSERRAHWVGLVWGLGHAGGVVLLGAVAWAFSGSLTLEHGASLAERSVGVLLVAVGAMALWRGRRSARASSAGGASQRGRASRLMGSFGFGVLHGAAGGSHLLGVLPAVLLQPMTAMAYLGGFAIGSTGAMVAFAGLVGRIPASRPALALRAQQVAGAVAIVVGLVWVTQHT